MSIAETKRPPSSRRSRRRAVQGKPAAFYTQLQTDTPAPEIADKAMRLRIAASHAGQPPPGKRLVSRVEVIDRIGVPYSTIWRWMRTGKFPMSRDIGGVGGQVVWLSDEIDEWIATRPVKQYKPEEA